MNIIQEFDTIAAIATPIGTGGVGVIRISGDKSFEIINKIYSRHNLEAGKISHGWIIDNDKKSNDEYKKNWNYMDDSENDDFDRLARLSRER